MQQSHTLVSGTWLARQQSPHQGMFEYDDMLQALQKAKEVHRAADSYMGVQRRGPPPILCSGAIQGESALPMAMPCLSCCCQLS